MKLGCRRYEKRLCLLVDGLLEDDAARDVKQHVGSCARCRRALAALRQSRAATDALADIDAPPLSGERVAEIVGNALESVGAQPPIGRPGGHAQRVSPRLAWMTVSVGAMCLLLCLLVWRRRVPSDLRSGSAGGAAGRSACTEQWIASDETFQWLNAGCAVRTLDAACISVISISARTARLHLDTGEALIAGIPGTYDTIEVYCGPYTVRTLGTRFSVRMENDTLELDVLKGSVFVHGRSSSGDERLIHAPQRAVFSGTDGMAVVSRMPARRVDQLKVFFGELDHTDSSLPRNRARSCPGEAEASRRHAGPAGSSPSDDVSYHTALRFYEEGMLHASIHVLESRCAMTSADSTASRALLGDCHNRLGRYDKAVEWYRRAAADKGSYHCEAALHQMNRLLLFRLGDYAEAQRGIERYLTQYPNGRYHALERYYLVQVFSVQGRNAEASRAARLLVRDHPRSCQARCYTHVMGSTAACQEERTP